MNTRLSERITKQDHVQGGANAKITLVEYGDYECPSCGGAYFVVKKLQKRFGSKLRFVFRNFPLTDIHRRAEMAAEAAEAADAQGKFWEVHDGLFENQNELGEDLIMKLAADDGLNKEKLVSDLETRKYKNRVAHDFETGVKSGVEGTPTFYINGERFDGSWDEEEIYAAIKKKLDRASQRSGYGTPYAKI